MTAYYNEIDPFAAAWLRELIKSGHIAPGEVDERSIEDVDPRDLARFTQCHFFAGIGVWSYALRCAGWPDDRPIWTGSCPCQPFSAAGKGEGFADERHLWPAFFHLISQCRPLTVAGEQVTSKDGLTWFDLVAADLEGAGYTCGAVDTCSAGFGAPHIRQRLYWMAHTTSPRHGEYDRQQPCATLHAGGLEHPSGIGRERRQAAAPGHHNGWATPQRQEGQHGPCLADSHRLPEDRPGPTNGFWRDSDWLFCRDGKFRPVRPGSFPLVNGTAARVGRLRGYGNAINKEQAQAFIEAYMARMPAYPMILDAAGKIPVPQTEFERRIAEKTANGGMKRELAELKRKQALTLDEKISLSLKLIQDWHEAWDGQVAISYSGGKDSEVLKWLVRMLYPHIPAVFCHTGLEYPEVIRQVLATPNHIILKPEMRFGEVIRRYGWPIASKKIARGIDIVRHPTGKNKNIIRLYLEGINRHGREVEGFRIADQWRFLLTAPFACSDKCCNVMKKNPMSKFEKESGMHPYVGTMASDSKQRQRTYLQQGCNAYDMNRPRSAPLSFWTKQDILQCIHEYAIPVAQVYGEIIRDADSMYHTTGVSNTGCVFCCFGLTLDKGPKNRFEQLAESHPRLHKYVMDKLGLRRVLHYCRRHAPPTLAKKFRCGGNNDVTTGEQLNLLDMDQLP